MWRGFRPDGLSGSASEQHSKGTWIYQPLCPVLSKDSIREPRFTLAFRETLAAVDVEAAPCAAPVTES